jgi:hypothetical protein
MSVFTYDNNWQINKRNCLLKPFYSKRAFEGRFIFCDKGKLANILQREMAVDTILQVKENRVYSIEEKIVRWKGYHYSNYTLETYSCTVPGREKKGWMYYGKCDLLLYCFEQEDGSLEAHGIPFARLQVWFFSDDNYKKYKTTVTEQINHTECRVVPIGDVFRHVVGCKKFMINSNVL